MENNLEILKFKGKWNNRIKGQGRKEYHISEDSGNPASQRHWYEHNCNGRIFGKVENIVTGTETCFSVFVIIIIFNSGVT